MLIFTYNMRLDIWSFGERMRKLDLRLNRANDSIDVQDEYFFAKIGKRVLNCFCFSLMLARLILAVLTGLAMICPDSFIRPKPEFDCLKRTCWNRRFYNEEIDYTNSRTEDGIDKYH
jgi:hypothetical protein